MPLKATLQQLLSRLTTSRANAHAGLVSDTGISLLLLGFGLTRREFGPLAGTALVLSGALLFTFVEYCFHRWMFHGAQTFIERGHYQHHQQPLGHDALPFFVPPLGMLALAAGLALLVPAAAAALFAGGVAAGYAAYGLGHVAIHSLRFRSSLARRWAAAHHIHHRHPGTNFGVTSPLWDILLRTRYVSARPAGAPAERRQRRHP